MFDWVKDTVGGLFGGGSSNSFHPSSYTNDFSALKAFDNMSGDLSTGVSAMPNSTSGLFDSAIDWLGQNKDGINTIGGLFDAYGGYQSSKDMANMMRQQMALTEAERQRQIQKENLMSSNMQEGFQQSGLGLYDEKRKRNLDEGRTLNNSNYYSV